jgi:aminoglycoside phosphotransferase (APT) family kinase protein
MGDLMLVGSGRNADLFAIDGRRVLRRYRDGGNVAAEAAVMSHLAGLGFPVPEVYEAAGTDLVMERLDGPIVKAAMLAGGIGPDECAEVLARLHRQLHELPARRSREPGASVLHLDLHPDNVVLSQRGPVLIDWRNSTEGPPEPDVAVSAVILAQVAVTETQEMAVGAEQVLTAFLALVDTGPLPMLDRAAAMRASDRSLTPGERDLVTSATALIRSRLSP